MKFDVHPKSWTTNLTLWGAFLWVNIINLILKLRLYKNI